MDGDMEQLIERLKAATGPDREIDLAIKIAMDPAGDIADATKHRRGLDGAEGYSWDIVRGSVILEKYTSDGRCPFNAGYQLPAYTASIDSALTLVPDGLAWTLGQNVHHRYWLASVNNLDDEGSPQSIGYSGLKGDPTPALALCIAALKARQSFTQ